MDNKNKPVKKRRRFRIKIGYIFAAIILIAVMVLIVKMVLPGNGINKYGDRLEGIKDVKFSKDDQKKIVEGILKNENITTAKLDIKGKIVYVIINVKKEVSKDDSKKYASSTLELFSKEVKGFYDLHYIVTKTDEEGTKDKVLKDDGSSEEVTRYTFPIMGYKNKTRDNIIWSNN